MLVWDIPHRLASKQGKVPYFKYEQITQRIKELRVTFLAKVISAQAAKGKDENRAP